MLQQDIEERVQLKLPLEAFRSENVGSHLLMNFRVEDEHGRVLGQSRNLAELRGRFAQEVERQFEQTETPIAERKRVTAWTFGQLPESRDVKAGGRGTIGFPGLADEGDAVSLRVFDTQEKARRAHRAGLRRLFALELREQLRYVEKSLPAGLPNARELVLAFIPFGTESELKSQLVAATLERTCMAEPWPANGDEFARRKEQARPRIALVAQELARLAATILSEHAQLQKKLAQLKPFPAVVDDIKMQMAQLLPRDFLIAMAFERLQHYPRYLKAASLRLDKLRADPARDERLMREFALLARPFERERAARLKSGVIDPQLEDYRWLLEELRVQLFAQELRTPVPVSVKRLHKIWESRPR